MGAGGASVRQNTGGHREQAGHLTAAGHERASKAQLHSDVFADPGQLNDEQARVQPVLLGGDHDKGTDKDARRTQPERCRNPTRRHER